MTVQKMLRRSIEDAVKDMICDAQMAGPMPMPAPSPAFAPTPAGLNIPPPMNAALLSAGVTLRGNAPAPVQAFSPAPAPGPAACVLPKVHVAFSPGRLLNNVGNVANVAMLQQVPADAPPP